MIHTKRIILDGVITDGVDPVGVFNANNDALLLIGRQVDLLVLTNAEHIGREILIEMLECTDSEDSPMSSHSGDSVPD